MKKNDLQESLCHVKHVCMCPNGVVPKTTNVYTLLVLYSQKFWQFLFAEKKDLLLC